jgi:hypothetical protein
MSIIWRVFVFTFQLEPPSPPVFSIFPVPLFFFFFLLFFVPSPLETFFSAAVAGSGSEFGTAARSHEPMRKSGFRAKKVVGSPPKKGMNLMRLAELVVLLYISTSHPMIRFLVLQR